MYTLRYTFLVQKLIPFLVGASVELMGWSVIEPGMYLIAACLLALKPLLGKVSLKELRARLRNTSLFRTRRSYQSADSEGFRHKPQPPENSGSGFIELQSGHDRNSTREDATSAPSSVRPDLSSHRYDVEKGLVPPVLD